MNDGKRSERYKRKYDRDFFHEHFDSPAPPATDASITGNDAENRKKTGEKVQNGRGQTLCARSDERKLTHTGLRASIEFTPINTALCTPRRPFHGGNSESRRVFDPAEEKAA